MYFIEEDSYTCPYCGVVIPREELNDAPLFKDAITKRNDIQCPNCKNYGMNYMTRGGVGYGMIGYTLGDIIRRK